MAENPGMRSVTRPVSSNIRARLRRATLQRALPIGLLALGVVGMPTLLLSSGGLARLDRLEAEREKVSLEISRLTKRIEYLRSKAEAVKSNPETVERSARDQLGLLRRTEIVYHFESEDR